MTTHDEQFGTDPAEIYIIDMILVVCLVGIIAYTSYIKCKEQKVDKPMFHDHQPSPRSIRLANRRFGGWDISTMT
jgi:hypothetical protein